MDIAISIVIACTVVGGLTAGVWFCLADTEDPAREITYDRAAAVCFLTAMGGLAMWVVLALRLLARG